MRPLFIAAFTTLIAAQSAAAHEFTASDLVIGHPYSFETTATAQTGIGFLTITNNGDTPDRLMSVEADFDRVSLHRTEEQDGVARMLPQPDGVEIAPGAVVTLEPGGLHVMFMGLGGDPLELGEAIPATLIFEEAGPVDVVFYVESRKDGMKDVDHSNH
ncbi:copper chaperone PCu(A)C [Roseovarius sp. LXJ103]|uniref:copper chaperone PCu(A)C n=1 Tax=Roseovarius carneus TaxID=2853164 RepID=UPI000D61D917|nr:copper chaperone PCu(A)C [Roseovarius carneus]MBZ8118840.1 copper chaperone PCu(A)C [Roseovarius carneus]PWE35494.1 hypothetical protein DD563_05675 [Pelagicola sp. LXJ1103]